jgi:ubiquinone/menaquinone biosynthesis C-methylase UbiE
MARASGNMSLRVAKLYKERFSPEEVERKNRLWRVLCAEFFQKFVAEESTVLDIGAGYCEFINNIRARRKYAVDLNQDTRTYANQDVEVFTSAATDLHFLPHDSVDIVFMSNLLEHMQSKEEVLQVLVEVHRVCKSGGRVLILQPNIRYVGGQYWDFFDHRIPLSDRSLAEALQIAGFEIVRIYPRFLPYTTKRGLPKAALLVKLYLRVRPAWWILGKQAFVVGKKA